MNRKFPYLHDTRSVDDESARSSIAHSASFRFLRNPLNSLLDLRPIAVVIISQGLEQRLILKPSLISLVDSIIRDLSECKNHFVSPNTELLGSLVNVVTLLETDEHGVVFAVLVEVDLGDLDGLVGQGFQTEEDDVARERVVLDIVNDLPVATEEVASESEVSFGFFAVAREA